VLKTCRKPSWLSAVATTRDDRVLNAIEVATGIVPWSGRSTISAIWSPDDLATFGLRTRKIIAVSARATSMRTRRTWLHPRATTHTVLSRWRCGWWWRTGCLTARPVGIFGEIIASLCPLPPSRTGLRPGGKKAEHRITGEYLDGVLANFSGYIAADELYDGPFCVLSIVDNHTFRRITYEVLDHDPTHTDMERFFRTFQAALQKRRRRLEGITTDGSVRRESRRFSAGAIPARQLVAPAGSNRSGRGGDEPVEAFGVEGRLGRLGEHAGRNVSER